MQCEMQCELVCNSFSIDLPRIARKCELNKSATLNEVREENIMTQKSRVIAFFLLVAMGAASRCAQATNLTVNCDRHESLIKP
jgi:hypothetical protein